MKAVLNDDFVKADVVKADVVKAVLRLRLVPHKGVVRFWCKSGSTLQESWRELGPLTGERNAGEQHGFGYGHGSSCGGGVHSRQAQPQVSSSAALGQKLRQSSASSTQVHVPSCILDRNTNKEE